MIKHKQNKKTPDIYSLPLKCDLCPTFSIKTNPENIFRRVSQMKLVPASLGETFIPRRRNAQLAACWDYNHVLGLPAVLLLKMTQSE